MTQSSEANESVCFVGDASGFGSCAECTPRIANGQTPRDTILILPVGVLTSTTPTIWEIEESDHVLRSPIEI